MTVLYYMARQREKIINRHAGETFLYSGGEALQVPQKSAREILREMDGMEGLNVQARIRANSSFNSFRQRCFN